MAKLMKKSWREQAESLFIPSLAHVTQLEVVRGKDGYLFDRAGKRYLDFSCGIGVTNLGHCPPAVVKAIEKQAKQLLHICFGIAYYEPEVRYAEALQQQLPAKLSRFFFCQTGSEAIDGALKLARFVTKRQGFIAFDGSFHGRTLGALSVTGSKPEKYRTPYLPLIPGVSFVPYPYHYGSPTGMEDGTREAKSWCQVRLAQLEQMMKKVAKGPGGLAAVIIEPVLGEGGYQPALRSYLKQLRKWCDRYQALLIFDEVQSGFGRTGRLMAFEHYGVVPDILALAKGIASGLPLGAIVTSPALAKQWTPGAHGSTFSGNPLSCAAALAMLEEIKNRHLLKQATKAGAYLIEKLRRIQAKFPSVVSDVRGLGLMVGLELTQLSDLRTPPHRRVPNPLLTKQLREACLQAGLLLLGCGAHDNVIRWVPPLTVTLSQIDHAVHIFEQALSRSLR